MPSLNSVIIFHVSETTEDKVPIFICFVCSWSFVDILLWLIRFLINFLLEDFEVSLHSTRHYWKTSVNYYRISIATPKQFAKQSLGIIPIKGACVTSNIQNPVRKFAKFSFTEPIEWKTLPPAKLLIECNTVRNK